MELQDFIEGIKVNSKIISNQKKALENQEFHTVVCLKNKNETFFGND